MFPRRQLPVREKKPNDDCEIKVKRDGRGRVVGIKSRGKCTKEDKMMFLKDNNLDVED